MSTKSTLSLREVADLVKQGEGPTLEFKRSTGELKEGMLSLCAFLNGSGGTVLFGIRPNGGIEGQDVSEQTFHDIAQAAERFEPAAHFAIHRVRLASGKEIVALTIKDGASKKPFTYEGRPYERIGNTTRKMPQGKYEGFLLLRAHGQHRWENAPADGFTHSDLDRNEVFRILEAARVKGYLLEPVGKSVSSVLDRLGVRQNGQILQAAVVLFGKKFQPAYPQCELRMARFRGIDKAEFMDQRNVRASAFKLLEEAEMFCQRHFPLPGKIVPGKLQRQDKPLIPPDAMREILVNALIHRDYSIAGGAISLAIFDDRVEIWSAGRFPTGITPVMLSREHDSVQRNPIIADVFHRAGLIERWGRGTNRVISMCRAAGIRPPEFAEVGPSSVVIFRVNVAGLTAITAQVTAQVTTQVAEYCQTPRAAREIMAELGLMHWKTFQSNYLLPLMTMGVIERTIPDKPKSRLQKYRLTETGKRRLEKTK